MADRYPKECAVLIAALDQDTELALSLLNKLTAEEKQSLADSFAAAFAMIVNPGAVEKLIADRDAGRL